MNLREILTLSKVIPVLELQDAKTAVDVANALCEGGCKVLEITLRTDAAFDAMEAIKSAVPDAIVGAGTVNNEAQVQRCKALELDFMVSPGFYPPLAEAARNSGIAYLPGVATASEVLAASNHGLDTLKFFPAVAAGGVQMLKALGGPYGDIKFCPTGGISAKTAADFLNLDNVLCVGGSWVAPSALVKDNNFKEITALAAAANQ